MGVPAIIEQTVDTEMKVITNVLAAHPYLPPATFRASFMTLVASSEKIQQCTPASLVNCLASAAGLGLPMQSQLGQFFILPFKLHGVMTATPVIGVKGYNTLGARDDYSMPGEVVRERDVFEYEYGTNAFVSHKPVGPRNASHKIVGAWAMAEHLRRKPIVKVMEIEEMALMRDKSPAVKYSAKDSPWNDTQGIQLGLVGMYEKLPKRRLAKSMPLNIFVTANAMETSFEITGRPAYLLPNKEAGCLEIVDGGTGEKLTPDEISRSLEIDGKKKFKAVLSAPAQGSAPEPAIFDTIDQWRTAMFAKADRLGTKRGVETLRKLNEQCFEEIRDMGESTALADVMRYLDSRHGLLP